MPVKDDLTRRDVPQPPQHHLYDIVEAPGLVNTRSMTYFFPVGLASRFRSWHLSAAKSSSIGAPLQLYGPKKRMLTPSAVSRSRSPEPL